MRRTGLLLPLLLPLLPPLLLLAAPASAVGQSSQFSVSGLGLSNRGLSARAWATGGGFGLFDSESSLNPAALGGVATLTASFTGIEDFRQLDGPAGDASARGVRFPQFAVAGKLGTLPFAIGVSYSSYTTRDFTFGLIDTIDLRGVPVEVGDTFSSRGGLNDLRLGIGGRLGARWSVGAGLHILTGSNRLQVRRGFSDGAYLPTRQRAEVGYSGVGVSVGVAGDLTSRLGVALVARADGHLDVERDSTFVGTIDLPHMVGAGLRWRPAARLSLAGQVIGRTWSAANSDLLARGDPGAENTMEASLGAEFIADPRRPTRRPLRLGAHYATLPFPLAGSAEQPTEFGVSVGTGARFAMDRAGVDLAVERVWRSAGEYSEDAWHLLIGVSVRP